MSKVAVLTRIVAQPGQREALVTAIEPYLVSARAEEGTLGFALHLDQDDPDGIWFYSLFADEIAWQTHRDNEAKMMATDTSLPALLAPDQPAVFSGPAVTTHFSVGVN